jgi:CRISPR-associated endonuclease/helicase Cas3
MTTIRERMPGRPPVAPWLRGVDEEPPQTTIAWRAELDLDGFAELGKNDVEEWFDAHRILPHETLAAPSNSVSKWLLNRWTLLTDEARSAVGDRACVIDQAGIAILKLRDLILALQQEALRKRFDSIRDADVILPASFGGIERHKGLLDEDAPKPQEDEGEDLPTESGSAPDVADQYDRRKRSRLFLSETGEEVALTGEKPGDLKPFSLFTLSLPADGDSPRQLVSLVSKRERLEYGTTRQSLSEHVHLVKKHAAKIAEQLDLSEDIRRAFELAATWHDHGKDRPIWQHAVGRRAEEYPVGKSGGSMRRIAGDYRHEFGSVREFAGTHEKNVDSHVFDLAMHLIATHHGRGRPHFPKGGFDPLDRATSPQIAADGIRRFARLQRRYGYWRLAWLENLLRCADAMASAENKT